MKKEGDLEMFRIWLMLRSFRGLRNRRFVRFVAGTFGRGGSIVEVEVKKHAAEGEE